MVTISAYTGIVPKSPVRIKSYAGLGSYRAFEIRHFPSGFTITPFKETIILHMFAGSLANNPFAQLKNMR